MERDPTGGASFNPASTTTDVNGVGSTTTTLGAVVGASPSTPRCRCLRCRVPRNGRGPLHLPDSVHIWTDGQCRASDDGLQAIIRTATFYYDYYGFSLPAGTQSIRHQHEGASSTFDDTYMDFFRGSDGKFMAFDDDSVLGVAGARNSLLDIILPGADYIIGQARTIRSSRRIFADRHFSAGGDERVPSVWVTRGVSVSDSITLSDCADSSVTRTTTMSLGSSSSRAPCCRSPNTPPR